MIAPESSQRPTTNPCRDGASRQFGFVGFKSVDEAEAAQKYFNKSFMGTVRLAVEVHTICGIPALRRQRLWQGCAGVSLQL